MIAGTISPPSYALEVGSILYRVLDLNLHLELVSLESLHEDDHERNSSDNGYFDFVPREAMLQIFQVVHFFAKCYSKTKFHIFFAVLRFSQFGSLRTSIKAVSPS